MKVVVISNLFPNSQEPQKGIFTYQIVRELRKLCNVRVVAPLQWVPNVLKNCTNDKFAHARVAEKEDIDGIIVHHPRYIVIPKMASFLHSLAMFFPLVNCLNRLEEEYPIDVINAHWIFPDGVASVWAGRFLRKAVVLTALGCDINLYATMLLRRPQIRNALRQSDCVTAVSHGLRDAIAGLEIPDEKIRVIRNGVNLELFFVRDRDECRRMLMLPQEKQIILTVGRQDKEKDPFRLVEAFGRLMRFRSSECLLVLVGDGPLHRDLVRKVNELGISNNVLFAGLRPHHEIPIWLNAADVFCLPSIREGHPNAVIEALACGTPVVASRVGELPRMLNEESGLTVPVGDMDALSNALNDALTRHWSRLVIRATVAHFDWKQCAMVYHQTYSEILERHSLKRT